MRPLILLLLVVSLVGCGKRGPDPVPKEVVQGPAAPDRSAAKSKYVPKTDQEQLQGMWLAVGSLYLGASIAVHQGVPLLTISGDKIVLSVHSVEGGRLVEKDRQELGTFTIDATGKPKAIDVTLANGPAKGKTLSGIYLLRGDDLALHLAEPGEQRPTKFQGGKRSFLPLVFRRTDAQSAQAERKAVISGEQAPTRLFLPANVRSARPVNKEETDLIYLNLVAEGRNEALLEEVCLVIAGESQPLSKLGAYLKEQYRERQRATGMGEVKTAVVLRAHRSDVHATDIHTVVRECRKQGFGKLYLRVWPPFKADGDRGADDLSIFGPTEGQLELCLSLLRKAQVQVAVSSPGGFFAPPQILVDGPKGQARIALPEKQDLLGFYPDALERHLKETRNTLSNKTDIVVQVENGLRYGELMGVIDACLAAGFQRIGLELGEEDAFEGPQRKEVLSFAAHRAEVLAVTFDPSGERLATAGDDHTARIWDAVKGSELVVCKGHDGNVTGVAFNPAGRRLATTSEDGTVRLWEAATGRLLSTLKGHDGKVHAVTFSPDAKHLASADERGVTIWEAATARQVHRLQGKSGFLTSIAYDFRGERLAAGGADAILVWDSRKGTTVRTMEMPPGQVVSGLAFSSDGRRLAAASSGPTPEAKLEDDLARSRVAVWDVNTGRQVFTSSWQRGLASGIAFPLSGRCVAVGSFRGAKLWDVENGETARRPLASLAPDSDFWTRSVASSPDGQRLACCGTDIVRAPKEFVRRGTVKVWRLPK